MKRQMWRRRLGQYGPPVALLFALLVLWEAAVRFLNVPKWLLPAPTQIVAAGLDAAPLLGPNVAQTVLETLLGLALALMAGVLLAFAIDLSATLRRALYPLLVVSQTIPILALAPLLIIWFGYDILPKVLVVALVCFFPVAVGTADGLRAADPEFINLLRAMGASRRQVFTKVRVPAALPSFFSGLKVAVTYSVIGAIIGEWVGASVGLGIFMMRSSKGFLTDRVFAAIAITSLLSIGLFVIVRVLERVTLPWYFAGREEVWEEVEA